MLKKLSLTFFSVFVISSMAYSQSGTLSGVVSDESTDEELLAVNVYIVEAEKGAVTDASGEYEITGISPGTYTVRATYIGYTTFESEIIISGGSNTLDISLAPDLLQLDDVVVTAMGVQQTRASVGTSVQSISGEELVRVPESNIVESLAGKISGVQVVGSAGMGGTAKIRIRGASGLSETPPLFVVDGTPIDNSSFTSGTSTGVDFGSGVADINPADIADISVLKGAAASALYGQRASGGVILITTKKGSFSQNNKIGITINHSTSFEEVYILPEYQDEYAGGGSENFISCVDPLDGQTYTCLNYAVDESWGPRMEGQMYRPYWSWYPSDVDDYGTEIALVPQPDNVRDFFETGATIYNNLALDFGNEKGAYRLGVSNQNQTGTMPNSKLVKTTVSFNGSLNLTERWQSSINFNYSHTDARERPDYGYNGDNPMTSFNQWFQRQLDIDRLLDYIADDGSFKSWNINSPTNLTPLYWDSPYFSVYENVPEDNREHLFGNASLSYNVNENLTLRGTLRRDSFTHFIEDKIGSGGISTDWYAVRERHNIEDNYEAIADYSNRFSTISFSGLVGVNYMTRTFTSLREETNGGLSVPNYYDIAASIDRPTVDSYRSKDKTISYFGTANVGYKDFVFLDVSLRNDNSSTLPEDNNSYWYGGASGSLILTELFSGLADNNILDFWKLRLGYGQVGSTTDSYNIFSIYEVETSFGSYPAMTLPNTRANENLKPAISDEFEYGAEFSFFNDRLDLDVNYYYARKIDEIIQLAVSNATGYDELNINAGKFIKKGLEVSLGGTAIQTRDFTLDARLNWSTNQSEVAELHPDVSSLDLDTYTYAREGEKWGVMSASAYVRDDNGYKVLGADGLPQYENNVDLGYLLPDWQGGFNLDFKYKNFGLYAFVEFQKGGMFYSTSKRYNAYSGMGAQTVGNNPLGNRVRDEVLNQNGESVGYVLASEAAANSGGEYIEGVNEAGEAVAYYVDAKTYWKHLASIREEWVYDASYVKLRDIRLSYSIPASLLSAVKIQSADIALTVKNAWLIWTDVSGLDPSEISNGQYRFSATEGGQLPGVRSVGFSVNLNF